MNTDLGRNVFSEQTGLSSGSNALNAQRVLSLERDWTLADGTFAVDSVPDRPPVAADTRLLVEELQFLSPAEGMNRVWINAVIEAERLTPVALPGGSLTTV